jgi:putative ABC transport system ATP-binding protein
MEKGKDSDNIIIHLKNVAKYYHMGESIVKAVDDVSIDIKKGDFVAVMGPSGSGKSTAMNLIGSLDMPTKGHIFLDNEDISTLDESELAQVRGKHIGFIFQQFNLIPTLTVKENVVLPMTLQGLSEDERSDKADRILHRLDLYERKDHYPNQISGGQQQRVAIARALANDPEVILADEPTGNLDTKTGLKVMDFLTELNKEGRTIVFVTHSPELAKKYAHTVYWLKDGKIEKITRERKKR